MKIAICQTSPIWENKTENIAKSKIQCEVASKKGSKLVLFPEMSFTGFSMNVAVTAENGFNLYTIREMRTCAIELGIDIGFGWVFCSNDECKKIKCENHYTVVNKHGQIVSDYVKIHPFSYSGENDYFNPGTELTQYEIGNIPFSTFICYDLRFPEIFQVASKKAHVIIVPAQWPESRRNHWMSLLQARAIENQVYVIGINGVGDIGGLQYSGDSRVINPNGEVVAEAKVGEETMLYYDLEDDVDHYRKEFPVKNDRREDLYGRLMKADHES